LQENIGDRVLTAIKLFRKKILIKLIREVIHNEKNMGTSDRTIRTSIVISMGVILLSGKIGGSLV